jgi:hypothetical protein
MHLDECGQTSLAGGSGEATTGRALIALAPALSPRAAPAGRRPSPFLAQLLAAKQDHPQARERRRAAPEEVIAAYCSIAALTA